MTTIHTPVKYCFRQATSNFTKWLKYLLVPLALAILAILIICYCLTYIHLLHNNSSSEPLGYYLVYPSSDTQTHQLRTVCLSNHNYIEIVGKLGLEKDNQSICNNGYVPLLKEVLAVPHDTVIINSSGMWVNNQFIMNSQQQKFAHGMYLAPQAESVFTLQTNEYFVMGNERNSYDSRYFGIVHAN